MATNNPFSRSATDELVDDLTAQANKPVVLPGQRYEPVEPPPEAAPAPRSVNLPNDPNLPAGMRNNNPGNIKYVGQRDAVGPSVNRDQGDPQAVYATAEDGMAAMFRLARKKYDGGKTTTNTLIAAKGGWTPGNAQAAANVARTMGIGPDDDLNLSDPAQMAKFGRALMLQEHGPASKAYDDDMIARAVGGASGAAPTVQKASYKPGEAAAAAPQAAAQPETAKAARFVPLSDDEIKQFTSAAPEASRFVPLSPDEVAALGAPESGGVTGFITDIGKNLKVGANMAGQDLRELVGKIPGVGQSIVEGADAVDRYFHPEVKNSDELLKNDTQQMVKGMTPEMRAALDKKWWDSDKGTFGEAWKDPRAIAGGLLQSLPEQAMTMVPAMALAKGAYAAKLATGAAEAVASQAATRTALVAGSLSEGALGGAQSSREVRDQVMELPQNLLDQSDAYKAMLAAGQTPNDARKALASDLSTRAFVTSGIVTGMFGGMGDRAIAKLFTEQVGKASVKQALGAFGKGALAEGLFEELPQSAGQQVAQNEALQQANPNVKLSDDVANQALGGAVLGGLQGGGMGALAHGRGNTVAPEQQPAAPAEAPPATPPVVPPSQVAPIPAAAAPAPKSSTPLTSAVEHTAEQPQRVVAVTPDGKQVPLTMEQYREDGDGHFLAHAVDDDGNPVTISDMDGVQLVPVEAPKGPLTGSLETAAEQHAQQGERDANTVSVPIDQQGSGEGGGNSAQGEVAQDQGVAAGPQSDGAGRLQNEDRAAADSVQAQSAGERRRRDQVEAGHGVADVQGQPEATQALHRDARRPPQLAAEPVAHADMSDDELRTRLKYLATQFRNASDRGVQTKIATERKAVEKEINTRAKAADVAAKAAEAAKPAPTGPFTSQAEANAASLKASEQTGTPHIVVDEQNGQFTIQPYQEAAHGDVRGDGNGRVRGDRSAARDGSADGRGLADPGSLQDAGHADVGGIGTASGEPVAAGGLDDGKPANAQPALKDAHAKRWFGSEVKAKEYIAKQKIGQTHQVIQTGKVRFEVRPKDVAPTQQAEATDHLAAADAKHAKQDEAVRQAMEKAEQRKAAKVVEQAAPTAEKVPELAPSEPAAKPKKLTGKAAAKERERQLADYFTPGNVVKGYGGHDRVLAYSPKDEQGNWSVTVEAVKHDGQEWVKDPNDNRVRSHSTMPGERELRTGPTERAAPVPTAAEPPNEPQTISAEAAATPEAETEPADDLADIPRAFLKKTKVPHEVWVSDEGKYESVDLPAHEALASVREDITHLRSLLDCLKG